jgi:phage gp16-like protein
LPNDNVLMEPLRKRPQTKPAHRSNDLARIHILKKDLNLSEDEYRDLLQTLTGRRSAGELSFEERSRVAAHFEKLKRATKPNKVTRTPKEKKVLAMWGALQAAGIVQKGTLAPLSKWLQREGMPARLEWLNDDQLTKIIEQLKLWCARVGVLRDFASPSGRGRAQRG